MAVWVILLSVCAAGLIGGLLNAFFAHEGFVLWRLERLQDGRRIWRPGFLGNMLVGAVAALVMATLYSPLGSVPIGTLPSGTGHPLTLGGLAGALLSRDRWRTAADERGRSSAGARDRGAAGQTHRRMDEDGTEVRREWE